MAKRIGLLVFLACANDIEVHAQNGKDSSVVYLDDLLEPTIKRKALFQAKEIQTANVYKLIAYDIDKRMMYEDTYADKNFKVKDGPATYYHPNGGKETAGNYQQNKKSGIWKSWYSDSRLKRLGKLYRRSDDWAMGSAACEWGSQV